MSGRVSRRAAAGAVAAAIFVASLSAGLSLTGCQTVKATGERHINLISQDQEIQLGKQADQQIVSTIGLVGDQALQNYVSRLGKSIAATTERPDLPWTFRVVDDPVVNAFAVPGGFVYVTRGIMNHVVNEAQLAGILGHEIGHVTAKHSVIQLSQQQLAQFGLGVATAIDPNLQQLAALAGVGLQLLFLKYSRQDESQADELGVRYMENIRENPQAMLNVMQMLQRISQTQGGGAIPEWLSTHPTPQNREKDIEQEIQKLGVQDYKPVDRDPYLRLLNGLVYGQNPREGYTRNGVFYHPDLRFQLNFPPDWKVINQKQSVVGISPQQDTALQVTLSDQQSIDAAASALYNQQGISCSGIQRLTIHGLAAGTGTFAAQTTQGQLEGRATFIQYSGHIFQLVGYSSTANWPRVDGTVRSAMYSFQELNDPQALDVQPMHVQIVKIDRSMTLREYAGSNPTPLSIDELALLNQMQPDTRLQPGMLIKRVNGQPPPK